MGVPTGTFWVEHHQVSHGSPVRDFPIGDDLLAGREYLFDHFTAPDAHFFWCRQRATQLEVDISDFPNAADAFEAHVGARSVKKVLTYQEKVNEGFAKPA